jgi:serine/threonine-protein kinase RsbW
LRREIERAARPESLQAIRDFIEEACRRAGVESDAAHGLKVAVDEACNNVIAHGYSGQEPGPIGVSFESDGQRVLVAITDRGRPFDPRDAPAPDLHSDWQARRVGGLGWHLIRQLVDEVRYERDEENRNRLTLVMKLGAEEG